MSNQKEAAVSLQEQIRKLDAKCRELQAKLSSQAEFISAVTAASDCFGAYKDASLVYQMVTPSFCSLTGKSESAILGKTDEEIFPPSEVSRYSAGDRDILAQKLTDMKDSWRMKKGPGYRVLEITKKPVVGSDGNPSGIMVTGIDITREEQLETEQQGFFNIVPAMLCIASADGYFLKLNREWEKVLGYSHEELLSTPVLDFIHPEDRAATQKEIERQLQGNTTRSFVNRYMAKDGSYRWFEWNATPAVDNRLYAVAQDITSKLDHEKQLQLWADAFRYCAHGIAIGLPASNRILTCNTAFAELYDKEISEVEGLPIADIFAPEERKRINQCLSEADVKGHCKYETRILKKDGSALPVQIELVSVFDHEKNILYRIATMEDIAERIRTESDIRESELRFRSLVESSPLAIFVQTGGCFAYLNPQAILLFGASDQEDLVGKPVVDHIHPDDRQAVRDRIEALNTQKKAVPLQEEKIVRCDGTLVDVEVNAVPFEYNQQDGALVFVNDITARKQSQSERSKLEMQLFQAQRMESIGRLAGGIAHDLNNLLTPILGYSELLSGQYSANKDIVNDIDIIHQAGLRARDLIWQLLAFSRNQTLEFRIIDLNTIIKGFKDLLRRTIREDIDITYDLTRTSLTIKGDIGQIEQIIMNLAINAQDAMNSGGKIRIATKKTTLEEADNELPPGSYAQLIVSDSGCGIDANTLPHIFEPFYTTKTNISGTGLGLATVYGIVGQHNGEIRISTQRQQGTSFSIFFPIETGNANPLRLQQSACVPTQHKGSIIVVEDDTMVRTFVVRALRNKGYSVAEAPDGKSCLKLFSSLSDLPTLIITDVVMKGMSGKELYEKILNIDPSVKVLYMSGYTKNIITDHGILDPGIILLKKPFSSQMLYEKVDQMLCRK